MNKEDLKLIKTIAFRKAVKVLIERHPEEFELLRIRELMGAKIKLKDFKRRLKNGKVTKELALA